MALLEGVRRIKLLGVVVACVPAIIVFGLMIAAPQVHVGLVMIVFPLCLGAVIYTFGWLIEGFVRPDAKRPSHQSPVTGNHEVDSAEPRTPVY
jgi:hypothetical protein